MSRAYVLICDRCSTEERSPKDTHKFPGWTEIQWKQRPLEEGHDITKQFLLCNKCTYDVISFLSEKGK